MTLLAFQTALADLVASPDRCLAVRANPAAALAHYDLDAREQARLAAIVWQRGMSANCTVYRATRVTPLYTLLPLTFALLGEKLTAELDSYWSTAPRMEIRFDLEIARFAAHLTARLEAGQVSVPWPDAVSDILALEVATETLRLGIPARATKGGGAYRLHPNLRVVALRHAAGPLLAGARATPPDISAAPRGECVIVLSISGETITYFAPPLDWTALLMALARGEPADVPAECIDLGIAISA